MYKNTAGQYVFFAAVDSGDGSAKTSGVDFYIAKDDGTQTAVNSATHIGNGQWRIDLTQAETNADVIGICCAGTGVVPSSITIYPVAKKTQDYQTELNSINTIVGKLPDNDIADQSTLTAIGDDLTSHRNAYTVDRAAKLDNLDATITSRLAASAAPAHFSDLAITETTGKVTVNNVDECKADVTNVTVGTNLDKTGYALTTSERSSIATAVWSATTRTLSSFGSLVADMVTGVWGAMTRTLTAGTRDTEIDTIVGKLPADDIASQSTLDAIGYELTLHRNNYTVERAAKLDNLDASISSRLAAASYTAPPTVDAIVAGVESEQGKLHETLSRAENTDELLRELTEDDGTGNQRLTAKALEQAPAGETVWSSEQRDAVLEMASTRLVTQSRINTTTTPWRLELLVDQTIVKAYECYDINGAPITSTDAIIAKYVEVV